MFVFNTPIRLKPGELKLIVHASRNPTSPLMIVDRRSRVVGRRSWYEPICHLSSRISTNKGEPPPPSSALRAADSKFMYPSSIQSIRRQSQRDAGALLGGSKGCGREMGVDAPLRDGFWDGLPFSPSCVWHEECQDFTPTITTGCRCATWWEQGLR